MRTDAAQAALAPRRATIAGGECQDCGVATERPYARFCAACRWRHRGKPSTYRLTPERIAYLRTHYRPTERGVSTRIAKVLQVPKWRVCRWAAELGLTGPTNKGPEWTAAEDAFLEKHLGSSHVNWIAKRLGRSITAVQVRAKRLRLSRLPDGYSQQDVALAFGVERGTVERWLKLGWMKTAFVPTPGQPYRVTDADLLRFIRTHRTAFELGKCDQVWLLGLLLDSVDLRLRESAA